MLRIGLTGGIGAGKSTVSATFSECGGIIVDGDVIAREVVEPGTEGLALLVKAFGEDILLPDGALNRPALAAKAFVDWVLTKDAGQLNVSLSNRLSVRKDVPPAPGAPTLDSVKLVAYDRDWATQNKDRLIKAWQQAVDIMDQLHHADADRIRAKLSTLRSA